MPHESRSCSVPHSLSRRGFLAGLSAGAAGAGLAACASGAARDLEPGVEVPGDREGEASRLGSEKVPFGGEHQAGIATPFQAHLNLVAFSFRGEADRGAARRLMRLWTEDARRLCEGRAPLGDLEPEMVDAPANLTVTCGFGATFFDIIGRADARPEWLGPLPAFSRDRLDDRWGGADVVLQLCSDDPVTLSHATRHMIRAGVDYVSVRWFQQGFLNSDGTRPDNATPRNLFGQKDGTVNPRTREEFDDIVWIDEGPDWLRGGTALVVRRVAMDLDEWEMLDRTSREVVMGRTLDSGAPLTGEREFDTPDFEATDSYGLPVIDPASHVARSTNPKDAPHQKIRRRAFNYDLPPEPESGQTSNAGLIFICFQKNPLDQFVPIQRRLDEKDRLNQWITHIGSAVFACPPGVADEERGTARNDTGRDAYWGATLLED
ncbi:Dyp-type peroxidase [Corynebacterium sp. CCM 8835]|uniref:Dyp-type peroxidase n=1 Tax=Corynebacterium antarcticum TaxID=2800405 RepID=A0ABS1FKS1_9CORY|nr:Dyp-type peroxidase [Corynebacterium antarcticum]MCK7641547.1 Dyp-type peroxidase [Corynebacterium antarcticum]MCK7660355.1 Dyp-type peroxidase [Corynebacterium antarcticum]MCL0244775.1 Dyp-type peroxidase [Corynebacterium antarcticum]MCX7491148.1 Dyp-type peroxidase [Corynebacterium antarcticum]MCX7539669.1 Dyp-type peroxidase [Corynebacterium antarcticum]